MLTACTDCLTSKTCPAGRRRESRHQKRAPASSAFTSSVPARGLPQASTADSTRRSPPRTSWRVTSVAGRGAGASASVSPERMAIGTSRTSRSSSGQGCRGSSSFPIRRTSSRSCERATWPRPLRSGAQSREGVGLKKSQTTILSAELRQGHPAHGRATPVRPWTARTLLPPDGPVTPPRWRTPSEARSPEAHSCRRDGVCRGGSSLARLEGGLRLSQQGARRRRTEGSPPHPSFGTHSRPRRRAKPVAATSASAGSGIFRWGSGYSARVRATASRLFIS